MKWKNQEIPFNDPESNCMFVPGAKPLLATPGALEKFTREKIVECLHRLQTVAREHEGIDYLQVFEEDDEVLWFLEDGDGGAITALLPEDY